MSAIPSSIAQTERKAALAERKSVLAKLHIGSLLVYIAMFILLFIILFPFWWMIRTALTRPSSVFTNTSSLTPVNPTVQNFERVLGLVDSNELVGQRVVNSNLSTAT